MVPHPRSDFHPLQPVGLRRAERLVRGRKADVRTASTPTSDSDPNQTSAPPLLNGENACGEAYRQVDIFLDLARSREGATDLRCLAAEALKRRGARVDFVSPPCEPLSVGEMPLPR